MTLQSEQDIANNRHAALINPTEIEVEENTSKSHGKNPEVEAPGNTSDDIPECVLVDESDNSTSDDIPEGLLDDESDNSTLTPSSDGQLMFCFIFNNFAFIFLFIYFAY